MIDGQKIALVSIQKLRKCETLCLEKTRRQTMQNNVSKKEWVGMFRDIGLTDDDMMKWHRLFETRHPDSHEAFLAWLGISPDEIAGIRADSR